MPKPPLLPPIKWPEIFSAGRHYPEWLNASEIAENQEKMVDNYQQTILDSRTLAWLRGIDRPVYVLAIAEDWCGDVVRHVPILQKMADAAENLKVKYISREQFPQVFVRFLTNGGEAIPKFIFFNDNFVECGQWGPMPRQCRELIARGKACGDIPGARRKVAALYDIDPEGRVVIAELMALIDLAAAAAV